MYVCRPPCFQRRRAMCIPTCSSLASNRVVFFVSHANSSQAPWQIPAMGGFLFEPDGSHPDPSMVSFLLWLEFALCACACACAHRCASGFLCRQTRQFEQIQPRQTRRVGSCGWVLTVSAAQACLEWASQCEALRAICLAGLCPLLLTPGRNWDYCVFSRDGSKPAE